MHVLLVLLYVLSLLLDSSGSSTEDPLDAFMTAVRSEAAMDGVERRKLHVRAADLRKDAQRLRKLVELTRPAQMPSLLPRLDPVRHSRGHTGCCRKYHRNLDFKISPNVKNVQGMCFVGSLKCSLELKVMKFVETSFIPKYLRSHFNT